MKKLLYLYLIALVLTVAAGCHEDPHNTFGGPSNNPKDTASGKRDTSSVNTHPAGN